MGVTILVSGTSRDSPTRAGWIAKGKKKPTIMFTGYEDKVGEKAVREMGGLIAAGVVLFFGFCSSLLVLDYSTIF